MLVLVALVLQPALLMYDRMVMGAAAAEGARLLKTRPQGSPDAPYEGFVMRRLASVPPVDVFHVHDPCSWDIELVGDEMSARTRVVVTNRVRPLPLIGGLWARGSRDGEGCIVQRVEVGAAGRPGWVDGSSAAPADWVAR